MVLFIFQILLGWLALSVSAALWIAPMLADDARHKRPTGTQEIVRISAPQENCALAADALRKTARSMRQA